MDQRLTWAPALTRSSVRMTYLDLLRLYRSQGEIEPDTQISSGPSICTQDALCTTGTCTSGTCTSGPVCTASSACTEGAGCTQGPSCTEGENCTDNPNDTCTGGGTCTKGTGCTNGDKCTKGTGCTKDSQCTGGPECTTGTGCTRGPTCTKANGSPNCTGGSLCTKSKACKTKGNPCPAPVEPEALAFRGLDDKLDKPGVPGADEDPHLLPQDTHVASLGWASIALAPVALWGLRRRRREI